MLYRLRMPIIAAEYEITQRVRAGRVVVEGKSYTAGRAALAAVRHPFARAAEGRGPSATHTSAVVHLNTTWSASSCAHHLQAISKQKGRV